MPLHTPEPPRQVVDTVQSSFQAMIKTGSVRLPELRHPPGTLALAQPHQIFSLGLADLATGKGLEAARSTGWRYLVQAGENSLASAETAVSPAGSEHVFSAFNSGRLVTSTVEAIRTAQGLPQVGQGNFELRLLRVPALYFTALWMHSAQGTDDVLIPLAPSPGVATGKPVPAAPLLQDLASKAKSIPAVGPTDRTGG